MQIYDFGKRISELKSEGKYHEAIEYFQVHCSEYNPEQIKANDFIVSAVLTCYRKASRFDAAFRFLSDFNIEIGITTNKYVLNAYGWLLADCLRNTHGNVADSVNNIPIMNELTGAPLESPVSHGNFGDSSISDRTIRFLKTLNDLRDQYFLSLLSFLFQNAIKHEKNKQNINWKRINEICSAIEPARLTDSVKTVIVNRKGKDKEMELASDKEIWYVEKSKALYELGLFRECMDLCNLALELFDKFHYSNDVWISRRIALSAKQLGDTSGAILQLKAILKRKKEWFIQKELAELLIEEGDIDSALQYSVASALNYGDPDYKVGLYSLMGDIFRRKGDNSTAFKHYILSKKLRLREDDEKTAWKVPAELQSSIQELGYNESEFSDLPALMKDLNSLWKSLNPESGRLPGSETRLSGVVTKVLHKDERGADGFIESDNKKVYYFRINVSNPVYELIDKGLKVTFKVATSSDGTRPRAESLKIRDRAG